MARLLIAQPETLVVESELRPYASAAARCEPAAALVTEAVATVYTPRLVCLDVLRGWAMVVMALDHTRDFFTGLNFAPEDITHTTGPLFFTRWITHFCAPIFFLLAGSGAYLSLSRGRSISDLSRFLWTRGLLLALLDLTVVAFGWTSLFPFFFSGVLWALGWSMVAMSFLIRLPVRWIALFGALLIVTHNCFDAVNPADLGRFGGLWLIFHGHGNFWIDPGNESFFVLFPLIPWMGVMAVGYAFGALLKRSDWRKISFSTGVGLTGAFLFLRYFHLYGNSHHILNGVAAGRWRIEPTLTLTIVSFLNTLKYPPSLQFLLMTLGPSLMALAWLGGIEQWNGLGKFLEVFGRVPLFFYLIHIYLIHTLAIYSALLYKQKAAWLLYGGFMLNDPPLGYGHSLPFIYAMWLGVVLMTYPLCRGFMRFKQAHPEYTLLRYF